MRSVLVGVALVLAGCDLFFPLTGPAPGSDAPGDVQSDCPAGYDFQLGNSLYRVAGGGLSWVDAATLCDIDGTHLAVPDLSELAMLRSHLTAISHPGSAWLGIARDTASPGTEKTSFFAVTGEPADMTAWNGGEPNDGNNGGNRELAVRIDPNVNFIDDDPTTDYGAICECDGKTVTFIPDWAR